MSGDVIKPDGSEADPPTAVAPSGFLHKIWTLTSPYFTSEERIRAQLLLAAPSR